MQRDWRLRRENFGVALHWKIKRKVWPRLYRREMLNGKINKYARERENLFYIFYCNLTPIYTYLCGIPTKDDQIEK